MTGFSITSLRLGGALGAIAAAFAAPAAYAQMQDDGSREVVQPLPPAAAGELREALQKLSSDPKNVEALLAAGHASLRLDDVDAAIGFFARAEATGEAKGRAKAGLGATQVYKKRPVEALNLFADALKQGPALGDYAGEYGLAYDLVGDNAKAQEYYRLALLGGPNLEISRRLALSQAIGGNQAASEATLLPMLQRRDLAAYRTRAFALAALGKTEEAVAIAEAVMPASLASRIAPYLRYMPKLTRAQQAAAGNFGHFPEADSIGKDDPRIAEYTAAAKPAATVASRAPDDRLVPAGEPLGERARPAPPPSGPVISVARAEPPRVSAVETAIADAGKGAAAADAAPPPSLSVGTAPGSASGAGGFDLARATQPVAARTQQPSGVIAIENVPDNTPVAAADAIRQGRDLPPLADDEGDEFDDFGDFGELDEGPDDFEEGPVEVAAAEQAAPEPASLAEAFADFSLPDAGTEPVSGAVDITAIKPAREPEKKAEPPKPVEPSRVWVQVATGRDRSALAFDWRRFTREYGKQLSGKIAFVVDWGQTNRLVTGPFPNRDAAGDFVNELKQAGLDSFMFVSAEGEKVEPLRGR